MAAQGGLQAAAQRRAVYGSDDRFAAVVDRVQDFVQPGLDQPAGKFGDVRPGNKRTALAVNHNCLCRGIRQRPGDALFQALAHTLAQGVDRGVVQGEDGDSILNLVIDHAG